MWPEYCLCGISHFVLPNYTNILVFFSGQKFAPFSEEPEVFLPKYSQTVIHSPPRSLLTNSRTTHLSESSSSGGRSTVNLSERKMDEHDENILIVTIFVSSCFLFICNADHVFIHCSAGFTAPYLTKKRIFEKCVKSL